MINRPYIAGLFDGEGCISLVKIKRFDKRKTEGFTQKYALQVSIGQNQDFGIFEELKKKFGGYIKTTKPKGFKLWHLWGKDGAVFLKTILPYLVIKKEQAQIGIGFAKEYHVGNKRLARGRGHFVSEETKIKREEIYQKLKELKNTAPRG